jgi:hypothetical protein
MILLLLFCIWIHKRKRKLRKHALANGIELDDDGWPVPVQVRVARALQDSQVGSNAELPQPYQDRNTAYPPSQSSTLVPGQSTTRPAERDVNPTMMGLYKDANPDTKTPRAV